MLFPFAYASYAGQTHASQPLFDSLIHNLSMRVLAFLFSVQVQIRQNKQTNQRTRITNAAAPTTLSRLRCFRSLPILPQLTPHPSPLISPSTFFLVSKLSGFSSAFSLQHIRTNQLPLSPPTPPDPGALSPYLSSAQRAVA